MPAAISTSNFSLVAFGPIGFMCLLWIYDCFKQAQEYKCAKYNSQKVRFVDTKAALARNY